MNESVRILLVWNDDETSKYLREQLMVNSGYSVSYGESAQGGLSALKQDNFDVIIAKFNLPDLNGAQLIKELKRIDPDCIIIVFLEDPNPQMLKELSMLGVYDFINNPINLEKLLLLIKKGAEFRASALASHRITQGLREHNAALEKQNILLAQRIEESTKNLTRLYEDLRSTYMRTIKVLAQAIDARDHYTHSHSEDVAKYAVVIATELGFSSKDIETFRQACELHDLGKIGIEDKILSKESELTAEEWIQIRRHPIIAVQILEPLTFLHDVIDLIRQHHEHYDGSGYPEGRRGEDILLGARIIHLADAYESMRSARSYRKIPLTKEEAILEIKINSGKQFDPNVVKAFLKIVDKL
jgi:putative nucleotidyltransferase with HDIG domain